MEFLNTAKPWSSMIAWYKTQNGITETHWVQIVPHKLIVQQNTTTGTILIGNIMVKS